MSAHLSRQSAADDRLLVLRAQDGDVEAFEQLVDRYQGRLFRAAYLIIGDRQDSEDAVQDALVLAWKRLHLLDDPAAFRGWVSRICTRRATDIVRRRARRGTSTHEMGTWEGGDDAAPRGATDPIGSSRPADPAHTAEVNAQMRMLAEILATIEPDLRTCWALREIDDMSYQEIARTLSLTEATVRGRIARARTQIIDRMKGWR